MVNWRAHTKHTYLPFPLKQHNTRKRGVRYILMKVKAHKARIDD